MMTVQNFERELHDICQPCTTLQCRLELARLTGGAEAMEAAVVGGLRDCSRILARITSIREALLNEAAGIGE